MSAPVADLEHVGFGDSTTTSPANTKSRSFLPPGVNPFENAGNPLELFRRKPELPRLEQLLDNTRCSPMSCGDFEAYLVHKEHSAENLMFYNWFRDYEKRWDKLSAEEQARSPPAPEGGVEEKRGSRIAVPQLTRKRTSQTLVPPSSAHDRPGTALTASDAYPSPPTTPSRPLLAGAQAASGTGIDTRFQPFRSEIDKVIAYFFTPGGEIELNIPSSLRRAIVSHARGSTHPTIFAEASECCYDMMRTSSLPGFLKFATVNVGPKKIWWHYGVGTVNSIISFVINLVCILLGLARGYRCIAIPFTLFGIMEIYGAWKGLCFQVYGRRARQLYPWELAEDHEATPLSMPQRSGSVTSAVLPSAARRLSLGKQAIFEREKTIDEPWVWNIQNRVYWKITFVAFIAACVVEAVWLSVPNARRR